MFETHGAIQIDNAFPLELVKRMQAEFFKRYEPYFSDQEHPDALRLGDRRFMLTVDIDELFGAPDLIGSPMLMPILRRIVGEDCVLGAYTAVISLHGSRASASRLHKDHPALFPNTEWHFRSPCFGAQIILPLVPLDGQSGTTRFFKGTHRVPTDEAAKTAPGSDRAARWLPADRLPMCAPRPRQPFECRSADPDADLQPALVPRLQELRQAAAAAPSDDAYERLPAHTKELVEWWREETRVATLARSQLLRAEAG